jgi:hypothetical protein
MVRQARGGNSNHLTRQDEQLKDTKLCIMLKKGKIKKVEKGAVRERIKFIAEIFGVAA